jgi:hypothetical protein
MPALIETVLGPLSATDFGFALPHEHVLCDFIGADKTGRHRWGASQVVATMRPYLEQARERGVASFVDCTPAYIGRDVRVLRRLSELTHLALVTNTGYYGAAGDKFLPPHAFSESVDQLADRWTRERERGIDGTNVRPGFVKIGVDPIPAGGPDQLSDVDAKLVRAAARVSKRTGLTVACHTVQGRAALALLALLADEKADPWPPYLRSRRRRTRHDLPPPRRRGGRLGRVRRHRQPPRRRARRPDRPPASQARGSASAFHGPGLVQCRRAKRRHGSPLHAAYRRTFARAPSRRRRRSDHPKTHR